MISDSNAQKIVAKIEQAINAKGIGIAYSVGDFSKNGVFVLGDKKVSINDNDCYGFYLRYLDTNLGYKPIKNNCGLNYLQIAKLRLVIWKPCDALLHDKVLNALKPLSGGFVVDGDERVTELLLTASSSEANTVKEKENLSFNTDLSLSYFDFTLSIRLSSNCKNPELCP